VGQASACAGLLDVCPGQDLNKCDQFWGQTSNLAGGREAGADPPLAIIVPSTLAFFAPLRLGERSSWAAPTTPRRFEVEDLSRGSFALLDTLLTSVLAGSARLLASFCKVSMHLRALKNATAISARLRHYIALLTPLAALPIFIPLKASGRAAGRSKERNSGPAGLFHPPSVLSVFICVYLWPV
jgi:hypothetical protein